MTGELEGLARRHPARVGIYVKDLQKNWEWSYHADDLFPSASLIKVPVMAGVFEKINDPIFAHVDLKNPQNLFTRAS